ncbi:hypothetical protein O0L34_g13845 [Tuta absoluta]|nr:hypothetical protein O0L34_g13845 [Tuta absoluta]
MTVKTLEISIKELIRTVSALENKVCVLEVKIIAQNDLISKQCKQIEKLAITRPLLEAITPTLPPQATSASDLSAQEALQRRAKRRRSKKSPAAAAAIKITSATQKRLFAEVTKNDVSTCDTDFLNCSNGSNGFNDNRDRKLSQNMDEDSRDSAKNSTKYNSAQDDFKYVTYKKKKRQEVRVGEAVHNDLQAIVTKKYINAWAFKADTTEEQIRKFLANVATSDNYFVEKRTIKSTKHAAFIIGVPENLFETFNTPSIWPQGVRFSRWFLGRPRHLRGEDTKVNNANGQRRGPSGPAGAATN